jgi:AcrR family transcriptional regulator
VSFNNTRTVTPVAPRPRLRPNGLPRGGQVTQIQRNRMLAAAVDTVENFGYENMTVAKVIGRARVSRKTFYDVFADREDCFLAVFERTINQARPIAQGAYELESNWRDGIRAALGSLLIVMDTEPAVARLCIVESLSAGERVLNSRIELLNELAEIIDRGRAATTASREPPEITAEGVVGAISTVLHVRLIKPSKEPLTDLLGPLMSMIVLPYLGSKAADEELLRPPIVAADRSEGRVAPYEDPLEGLNMRLTYRTVRVLMVIADNPGASNREIAEGAEIFDQGQISKLLKRLKDLKLIENLGKGQEKGLSNEWHLTVRGMQVERASRPH